MKISLMKIKISVNNLLYSLYKPAMKDSGAIVNNNNFCVTTFTFNFEITSTVYVKKEEIIPCC